jgi:hypothetical protein
VASVSYTAIWYVVYGEKVFGMAMYMPLVDPFGGWGFPVTVSFQNLIIFLGATSFIGADGTFATLIVYTTGLVDTFSSETRYLDRMLDRPEVDFDAIDAKLKDLVSMQTEIYRYILGGRKELGLLRKAETQKAELQKTKLLLMLVLKK